MTSILAMPLSMGPVKSVCGLTRFTTTTASAESRSGDAHTERRTGRPDRDGLAWRRTHRGADAGLGDAELREHGLLAGGRGAAVTAHAGHDVRVAAGAAHGRHERAQHRAEVADAAAADGEGDAVAVAQPRLEAEGGESCVQPRLHVVEARRLGRLPDAQHARELHRRHRESSAQTA